MRTTLYAFAVLYFSIAIASSLFAAYLLHDWPRQGLRDAALVTYLFAVAWLFACMGFSLSGLYTAPEWLAFHPPVLSLLCMFLVVGLQRHRYIQTCGVPLTLLVYLSLWTRSERIGRIRSRLAAYLQSVGIIQQTIIRVSTVREAPGPITEDLSSLTEEERKTWESLMTRMQEGFRPAAESPELEQLYQLKDKIRYICHCGNPTAPHLIEKCRSAR